MSLDSGEQAGVIWGGVAAVLVLGAGIFKAARARGDIHNEWDARVRLAAAVLNDKAANELRELRDEINEILPPDEAPFDPVDVIADLSPLIARAEQATEYGDARDRMLKALDRAKKVVHVPLIAGLTLLLVGLVALTAFYADAIDVPGIVRPVGFALVGVSALILAFVTGIYTVCQSRLSRGEILAGTSGTDAGSPS
ncbi:hypothetical protein Q5424_04930 [Conexibacter sp. JD483]|uniref:hypothetical protein n=1 Tax=unclassified Conexibacter TaxID=2627773 RepID=UPI0027157890|nr:MULTISPECIES: hypothetical protein [unclassified Conexibacter]MDO8184677.1 hypothetical protein [Conexibacter sp. CPCC 205706]MDO8197983.1 hypothetical protein [Conexibacter sp. CPCC 205762]MDR9368413.1 hypothetical protein [Conexibacter sp. JD483]